MRRVLATLAWLAVVIVIALGAAGLVTGLDHPPGSTGRFELTAAGDSEVTPLLDASRSDLEDLAEEVEDLSTQARGALAALKQSQSVLGSLADKIRVPDQHIVAIEAALGHHLQLVLTEQPEAAQQILADLSANKKGKASIAALSLVAAGFQPAVEGGILPPGAGQENQSAPATSTIDPSASRNTAWAAGPVLIDSCSPMAAPASREPPDRR